MEDVPVPMVRSGCILVKTLFSVISIGSEKSVMDFSQKSLIGKAFSRPDLMKQVINRAKKEGFLSTFRHAMDRLDAPLPLGYSSAGAVVEVGTGTSEFKVGDVVSLNGTGFASHSEYAVAPFNLSVKVPAGVLAEHAAFGTLGGIALEGIRNAELTPGSIVAVFGLGLIGLLTLQILKAYGYQVIGIDPDEEKLGIALKMGAGMALKPDGNLTEAVDNWTESNGVDAAIICAATNSNGPIKQAADICRFRGRIVMVGVTNMQLDRRQFYDKELSFVVSKSTGAGKGDPVYEFNGIDYPYGLVRWTQKRNIKEVLRLMSEGLLDVDRLITHRITIDKALDFYKTMYDGKGGKIIGAIITYPSESIVLERKLFLNETPKKKMNGAVNVGLIGAGMFGKNVLYPLVKKNKLLNMRSLATASGLTANDVGVKFNVDYVTTDYQQILEDSEIDAVFIATRHSTHASMIINSLKAGKSVFVEKPLADSLESLRAVEEAFNENPGEVMTGFCRRYSPAGIEMMRALKNIMGPKVIHYRVNAGYIPPEHWVQREPGGRIVGEVCHFIDFICALTGSVPAELSAVSLSGAGKLSMADNLLIVMRMEDGSIGNILYAANGNKSFSREYVEVYGGGAVLINDDFRTVTFYGEKGKRVKKWSTRDLGYEAEIDYFTRVLSGKAASTFRTDVIVTMATFAVIRAIETNRWVPVRPVMQDESGLK